MPDEFDPKLGKRLIAETKLRRAELKVERAINKALKIHQAHAMAALRSQHLTAGAPPEGFDLVSWDSTIDEYVTEPTRQILQSFAEGTLYFLNLPEDVKARVLAEIDVASRAEGFIEKVRTIGPRTAERLNGELSVGVGRGESIEQLTNRITDSFAVAQNHARTIARTETHGAAEATSYESAGAVVQGGIPLEKEWLATSDARTRPWHAEADGQTVPYDQPFVVDGEELDFPGEGSASNAVNCRCTTLFAAVETEN